jgi:hypothetical protein
MNASEESNRKSLEIGWIDWTLVAGYFAVALLIWHGIKGQSDFIVSKLIPYGVMLAVTGVFIDYFCRIFKFMGHQKSGGNRA